MRFPPPPGVHGDFTGFELSSKDPTYVVQSIVDFGKFTGLRLSGEGVKNLRDDLSEELATQELQMIHVEVQNRANDKISLDQEKKPGETDFLRHIDHHLHVE